MAAPPAPRKTAAPARAKPGAKAPAARVASGASVTLGLMLVILGAAVYAVAPGLFMVLVTGMAPSVLALFRRPQRSGNLMPTMVALNVAGVVPVLARLWGMGLSTDSAEALLRDPMMWLLMFGSALLALALQWALPGVTRAVLDGRAHLQQERLRKAQVALAEEWGADVGGKRPEVPATAETAPAKKA